MAFLKEHCETYKWLPMNRYGYLVIRNHDKTSSKTSHPCKE